MQTNEPAAVASGDGAPDHHRWPAQSEQLTHVIHYFDVGKREGKIALMNALQNQDMKMEEVLDYKIQLCNFLCQPIELADSKTGESKDAIRCVLIDEKGQRISCCSDGVFNSLRSLVTSFGPPPYGEPLWVTPRKQKSRGGYNFLILEPSLTGETAPASSKPAKTAPGK